MSDTQRAKKACAESINSSRRLAEKARAIGTMIDSSNGIPIRPLDDEDSLVISVDEMTQRRLAQAAPVRRR